MGDLGSWPGEQKIVSSEREKKKILEIEVICLKRVVRKLGRKDLAGYRDPRLSNWLGPRLGFWGSGKIQGNFQGN